MRLYTLQQAEVYHLLSSQGHYQASWDKIIFSRPPHTAYRWMTEQMELRGINCLGFPPVWAWAQTPSRDDINALLGLCWREEKNWKFLTLECPKDLVLLSSYNYWCMRFFEETFADHGLSDAEWTKKTFDVKHLQEYDFVHATLPYLQLDWVIDYQNLEEIFDTLD